MSHTGEILLYYPPPDHRSLLNSYTNLIEEIVQQFRLSQLDVAISAIYRHTSPEVGVELIEGVISNFQLCDGEIFKLNIDGYIQHKLSELSMNEHLSILCQLDFSSINPHNLEDAAGILSLLIYDTVKDILVKGEDKTM